MKPHLKKDSIHVQLPDGRIQRIKPTSTTNVNWHELAHEIYRSHNFHTVDEHGNNIVKFTLH